jgi:hypothetical protein
MSVICALIVATATTGCWSEACGHSERSVEDVAPHPAPPVTEVQSTLTGTLGRLVSVIVLHDSMHDCDYVMVGDSNLFVWRGTNLLSAPH